MADELDFDEIAQDAIPIPKNEQLKLLSDMANNQLAYEDEVESLEKQLSIVKERLRKLSEDRIPLLMQNLGVNEFKLTNGFKVTIKPWFSGKITEENQDEAYSWLESEGHGAIVKHDLTVQTRMSNDALLDEIREIAKQIGLDVKEKLGIHHSTFSAWIKEMVTNGHEIPRDILGVSQGFKTKIGR
jgi:hypothetical protein